MEIRKATNDDLESLYNYNSINYTDKTINSKKYIDFWWSRQSEAKDNILLFIDNDKNIAGQVITSPMSYYYKNKIVETAWGFDLIVEEKYRKGAWGLDLMMQNIDMHPRLFATGSNPTALAINLKLGMQMLGEIRKYVGLISPFWFPFNIGRGHVSLNKFPENVSVAGTTYQKIKVEELNDFNEPFNDHLLEIRRDRQFVQWRFENDLHEYAIYKENNSKNYFVIRTTIIKHITVMILVDYRCNAEESQFDLIIQAAKVICSKVRIAVLITGTSLGVFDKVLEHHHMKSIGRPRPILGYIKCKDRKEDIAQRNFCFVTLADSDGETNLV